MSMPELNQATSPVTYCQSLNDILESIALEEAALAHILNAEGEKIQNVVNNRCNSVHGMLEVNQSVNETLKNTIKMQMLLQFKLENVEKLLKKEPVDC